jgi:hypothetical protein
MSRLRLGVRQRLQTKRGKPGNWKTVDWMEFDVAYVFRSDDSVAVMKDDDYIEADFDWRLTPTLTLYSRDNRISASSGTDVLNAGAALDLPNDTQIGLDYSYISDTTSRLRAGIYTMLSDRYGLMIEEDFELDTPGTGDETNMETHVVLRRFFHKWVFDIGVHYEKSNDELAVLIGFAPKSGGPWGSAPSSFAYGER